MPITSFEAKPSKAGKTFALVLALHVGLLWLAQAVWTSEPAKAVREVVAAQLIQEFQAPAPPPQPQVPLPPQVKQAPTPQALPILTPQPALPLSPVPFALPAITTAPAAAPTPAPLATPPPAAPVQVAVAPARSPVVMAAAARMDSCAKPSYPSASLRLQEEGVVALKFLIGENGQVLSGGIEKSSGYKRLDDAALAALSLCKFKPATVDGRPKQEWSALRYRWELNQ